MPNDYLLLLRLSLPLDDVLDLVERLGEGTPRAPAVAIVGDARHALVAPLLEARKSPSAAVAEAPPEWREDAKRAEAGGPAVERSLSKREREVIRGLAAGSKTRAIAEHLMLAEPTVKTYIGRALEKLHAETRAEAVALAARRGLLD